MFHDFIWSDPDPEQDNLTGSATLTGVIAYRVGKEQHMDDTRGPVAPVHQPVIFASLEKKHKI